MSTQKTKDSSFEHKTVPLSTQNIYIYYGYSKERSQRDSSFEHPKHMQELMPDKKIFTIILFMVTKCIEVDTML